MSERARNRANERKCLRYQTNIARRSSLATFLRKRKTGDAAVDAWKSHYAQLALIFTEVDGFEQFMLVIANNILRDSIYGMIFRVSLGAGLSLVDVTTDIYVITTYWRAGLHNQANLLLAMILANSFIQMCFVFMQNKKKSWSVVMREALITLSCLRPAVDAYRVCMNRTKKGENVVEPLAAMIYNKCTELATESIPGAVLQIYVYINFPAEAGSLALLSIAISALTTGFAAAMIGEEGASVKFKP